MANETTQLDDEPVDLSEINIECIDDPILVHTTRIILTYENASILDGYDAMCTDCNGDKKCIAHEFLDSKKEEDINCTRCGATGRVVRTES